VPALAAPRLGGVVSPSNKPGPLFVLPAPRRAACGPHRRLSCPASGSISKPSTPAGGTLC